MVGVGSAFLEIDGDLSKLHKTLTGELGHIQNSFAKTFSGGFTKGIGKAAGVIGAATTGLGASFLELGKPLEQAHVSLEATFKAAGLNIEEFQGQIDKTVGHMQNFGHSTADTETAISKMTAAFQDPKKALADMGLVANIAAFKHISLADAAGLVIKAHAGSAKVFKEFGINIKDAGASAKGLPKALHAATKAASDYQKALAAQSLLAAQLHIKHKLTAADYLRLQVASDKVKDAHNRLIGANKNLALAQHFATTKSQDMDAKLKILGTRLGGQASAQAETFHGKMAAVTTKIKDFAAGISEKLGPALITAGPIMAGIGGIMSSGLIPALFGTAAGEDAVAASGTAMLGPFILIGLAIAALVAAAIYAYTHFQKFRDIVDAVATFFQDTVWPIIQQVAANIVAAFQAMWPVIQQVASDIVDAFRTAAQYFVETIWPIIQKVAANIVVAFQAIWQGMQWAWTNVGKPLFDLIVTAIGLWWNYYIKPLFAVVSAVFGAIWTAAKWWWDKIGQPVFDIIVGAIKLWWNYYIKPLFAVVSAVFGAIWTAAKGWWDKIGKPIFDAIVTVVKVWWNTWLKPVFTAIGAVFKAIWVGMQWAWDHVGRPVFDAIVKVATTAWDGIKTQWGAVTGFFQGLWNGLGNGLDTVLNGIIGVFETAINGIITLIDAFHFKLPDWLGGASFGFNISHITLGRVHLAPVNTRATQTAATPKHAAAFAEGGIVKHRPGGILAQVGEGRYDEAIIPLDGRAAKAAPSYTYNNVFNIAQATSPDQIIAAQKRRERLYAS